ncbi:MAG: tetratricopeptide repeat protein [Bacteroidetes bacterium]|nr:tetratricopeptide repeat protein [Bacteroidota bacterium]MCL1968714.1 tetratricopeptide repeat protein [Bacteroidota bacterium]
MKIATFGKNSGICFVIFLFSLQLFAQKPLVFESPKYEFDNAMELYQKEKYGSAQQYFKWVYENTTDKQQDLKTDSYFYMALCAANLFNEDAIFLLHNFIDQYPVSAQVPQAYFALGKFYFNQRNYKKTIESFDLVGEKNINREIRAEYSYKKGYSYFELNKFAEARPLLKTASEIEGLYQNRATYYLAFIAYQEKQYQAALEDFLKVQNDPEFKEVVPFYIVNIYLLQKKYDEVIAKGLPLYEKASDKGKIDISRCLALAYYELKEYEKADRHFQFYFTKTKDKIDRSDYYAAGMANFKTGNYKNAIDYLSKATSVQDKIAQNAYYAIGDCYIKMEEWNLASQALYEAYKMDFLPTVKEDALFNYAKIQFEKSSSSFNQAIKALEQYINEYPKSLHSDEVENYLSKIYLSTKNYQGAINSLEKIQHKSPALLKSYQRCTYFRGLELINNKEYAAAVKNFEKSLTYPMDNEIETASLYWKAEAQYRNLQYTDAVQSYRFYQKNSNSKRDDNYQLSFYGLGYALLKHQKYGEAEKAYSDFLAFKVNDTELTADTYLRMADCQFMQKKLPQAIVSYDKCAKMEQPNADYALYQMAVLYGYQKELNKKIATLDNLLKKYPATGYKAEAEFESASTYHALNQYKKAIDAYQEFINNYPKNGLVRQAQNKLAQARWNNNEVEQAIATFKYVLENYPGSQEAKDAVVNLETIYAELGKPSEFYEYAQSKNISFAASRQDSINYKSAENKYIRGEFDAAYKGFSDYLKQFPKGMFTPNALFYKAEYDYDKNRIDDALAGYEALISNYLTENNETALRKAGLIQFNKKNNQKAFNHFSQLLEIASNENNRILANNGVMRAGYELQKYNEVKRSAEYIIAASQAEREVKNDAYLYAGRAAMKLNDLSAAKKYFTVLAETPVNANSTEAAYNLALIELKQNNLPEAEKAILKIINGKYFGEYWIASTYILYGDWYAANGKTFQARNTYQSIIDNYDGEDLRRVAQEKLERLGE